MGDALVLLRLKLCFAVLQVMLFTPSLDVVVKEKSEVCHSYTIWQEMVTNEHGFADYVNIN